MNMACLVLSFNHPEITARCVRSALLHFNTNNIYLVHNGSQQRFVDQLRTQFPEVHHLVLTKNIGFSGGMNRGLDAIFRHSLWALALTNDTELLTLPATPSEPSLVAPLIYVRSTSKIDSAGARFMASRGQLRHCRDPFEFTQSHSSLRYVPGTAFLVHQEVFAKTKGFDESLGTYWEDVEWSQRVSKDFPLLIDTKFSVRHQIGKTCHKNSLYTTYFYQRNRKRVSRHYARGFERAKLETFLWKDWVRFGFKLAKQSRWSDLKKLYEAIRD